MNNLFTACRRLGEVEVHVDCPGCAKVPTRFVVVGSRGAGQDFVDTYEMHVESLKELAGILTGLVLEFNVKVGRIDAPIDMADMIRHELHRMLPRFRL